MDLVACHCGWDIAGVDELPAHHHPWSPLDRYEPTGQAPTRGPFAGMPAPRLVHGDPWNEPHFWVDWRAVAAALSVTLAEHERRRCGVRTVAH